MEELIFIKLGGSLITNKLQESTYRPMVVREVGEVLNRALKRRPDMRILLGHGSGSFGHIAAQRYGTRDGVHDQRAWRGFVEVANAAANLNALVRDTLLECCLPVISISPSASSHCENGRIVALAWPILRELLSRKIIPLIYGDVALDARQGGTIISTEELFAYLVGPLMPQRILLLGEVAGVLDARGAVIPHITPENYAEMAKHLGSSAGPDVTGGMLSKVQAMLKLVAHQPGLQIGIMSGLDHKALFEAVLGAGEDFSGTIIAATAAR